FSKIWVDLAQPRLGSEVVFATDDFFADKARLIDPAPPTFIPGKYDAHGKWMDGWESRRKRVPGHDWCVLKLGRPGLLKGLTIDTSFFTGNYPPACSLEWANSAAQVPGDGDWKPLLANTALKGDSQLSLPVTLNNVVTHLRLHIYPDGGVARLRVWGQVMADFAPGQRVDMAAMENGGLPMACNDQHFGQVANMLAPGKARDMGDGWETRRRREPGHDWSIIALARPGRIEEILVDTNHFKGNYPDRCFIQGTGETCLAQDALIGQSADWPIILPEQKLSADSEHRFTKEIAAHDPVKFVRLNIIPDGGVARLRLWGKPV
ncbi:MAG TPA: allantoicase, partial [Rhizomicrobium sp.]|nr:allantoicase [Rhizomicrobium sp.]